MKKIIIAFFIILFSLQSVYSQPKTALSNKGVYYYESENKSKNIYFYFFNNNEVMPVPIEWRSYINGDFEIGFKKENNYVINIDWNGNNFIMEDNYEIEQDDSDKSYIIESRTYIECEIRNDKLFIKKCSIKYLNIYLKNNFLYRIGDEEILFNIELENIELKYYAIPQKRFNF